MKVEELAKMIDHSLLNPAMTDKELEEGCEVAKKYKTASVCIKPYAVKMAAKWLKGSGVDVCTVVGFPHGNSSVESKAFETEQACKDGALEVDMVINVGKALSGDWDYITNEIKTLNDICVKHNSILKVIFENDYISSDDVKIKLCQICSSLNVAFVKTSTGYGFVKQANGNFVALGATDPDLALMRKYSSPGVQVKAAGGVRTFEDCIRMIGLGVDRIGTSATISILEEAKTKLN